MYSYEDRIRAVKLYIKLGKRTGPTIRQLGYPTKNSLKSWHREYEHSRDLQVGYGRSRQKYSDEQKQAAVEHYLGHDRCIASTMKALGYPCRGTLTAWIDELHPEVYGLAHALCGLKVAALLDAMQASDEFCGLDGFHRQVANPREDVQL